MARALFQGEEDCRHGGRRAVRGLPGGHPEYVCLSGEMLVESRERKSEAELALWMTNVPVEACASCHWKMIFQDRFCHLAPVFTWVFLLSCRWVQQIALCHLLQPITAMSSGAVCLLQDFLML